MDIQCQAPTTHLRYLSWLGPHRWSGTWIGVHRRLHYYVVIYGNPNIARIVESAIFTQLEFNSSASSICSPEILPQSRRCSQTNILLPL